jgi:aminoglycoside phosphotransferase family enzyme/predicted kinase
MDEPRYTPEELLRLLCTPETYPHRPSQVRLVQTHTSYVALVPPWVYKVKKPVNFGFLDYSTLERRRYFLQREYELNRALAPGIYRRILPIVRTRTGELRLGGRGTVVEYALQMRYIPQEWVLRHRLQQGNVRASELRRVLRWLVQRLHRGQEPPPELRQWGLPERLRISTDENFEQTRPFVGLTLSALAYEQIQAYVEAFYQQADTLLRRRAEEGWVRACHGDLHSEHIAYHGRRVLVYDCIEFNERFRYIDVANEIAFLAMDLEYYGRVDLARVAVQTFAQELGDRELWRLLDFYKCYRAYVRGKVESMRGTAAEVAEAERQEALQRARRYFQLALRYAVLGSVPTVVVVMGGIGVGKSTVARHLGQELGIAVLSSDPMRKCLAGLSPYEPSPEWMRPLLYAPAVTQRTYRTLWESALAALPRDGAAIVDATFARRQLRELFVRLSQRQPVRLLFVELSAPYEVLRQRVLLRQPGDSDAGIREFERLFPRYEPPHELPAEMLLRCDATAAPQEVCRELVQRLRERTLAQLFAAE